jgi:hypothetical protein
MSWKFKFTCGCTFPREQCVRKWIFKGQHYVCPKHPKKGVMEYRIATCELCLTDFKVQAKGQVPHFCPGCSGSLKEEPINNKKSSVGLIPLQNKHVKANIDRSNCKWRVDYCLKKYENKTFLPCLNCTHYQPKEDKPIIFAYHGQSDWLDD